LALSENLIKRIAMSRELKRARIDNFFKRVDQPKKVCATFLTIDDVNPHLVGFEAPLPIHRRRCVYNNNLHAMVQRGLLSERAKVVVRMQCRQPDQLQRPRRAPGCRRRGHVPPPLSQLLSSTAMVLAATAWRICSSSPPGG
jgi:hypothetical protein